MESLIVGILGAIIVWLVKSLVGLYLRRQAIKSALLTDIQTKIITWVGNKKFLDELIKSKLAEDQEVPYTAHFQAPLTTLYDVLLIQIISHLPDHFTDISKMYSAFKEADELLEGVLQDLTIWKEQRHKLKKEDIDYLVAKRDRIASYVDKFKEREIRTLSDLPQDYQGVQGAEVVTKTIPCAHPETN
jgi:hypothetical protein